MKSMCLLSNIIFGVSQTISVPIYCVSSWIILLPEAQSDTVSLLTGVWQTAGHQGSPKVAQAPESCVEVRQGRLHWVPWDSEFCCPVL
jgi:hypothetical protein